MTGATFAMPTPGPVPPEDIQRMKDLLAEAGFRLGRVATAVNTNPKQGGLFF